MIRYFSVVLVLLMGLISHQSNAQSVYSFNGIGTINRAELPHNFAMGGVGIGTPSYLKINTINPANLSYNLLSSFQVAVNAGAYRYKTAESSETKANGGLSALVYAFPVFSGKWSSSVGLLPYSTVNYNTYSEGNIEGTDATQISADKGQGGLNSLHWANGFSIKKKIRLGVKMNYVFGSITRTTSQNISGTDSNIDPSEYEDKQNYTDLQFTFGASYKQKLGKNHLSFGIIYKPESQFDVKSKISLFKGIVATEATASATLTSEFELKSPQKLGFGASFGNPNVFVVGVDYEGENWEILNNSNTNYTDTYSFLVGSYWIPDYDNINSVFRRSRYMVGFNYKKLPYIVKNTSIIDFGINFGASIPVSAYSSIDLGAKFGQTGRSDNGLVRENYFKVLFGATINSRWFIRRKYD